MIGAGNITFYDLMKAGYISADTYHFLMPRVHLSELSINELYFFKDKYIRELNPLFNDNEVFLSITYWAELKNDILKNKEVLINLLEECLDAFPFKFRRFVYDFGHELFLNECVYCTVESLFKRYPRLILESHYVLKLRQDFRLTYKIYCGGQTTAKDVTEKQNIIQEPSSAITMGKVSVPADLLNIENYLEIDAISAVYADCRKYLAFIYLLDESQLSHVFIFLHQLLNKLSVRTQNVIRVVGEKEFLLNYLFAEPRKLLKIRNCGRKSLSELEIIKPQLIEYIKELYSQSNTTEIENALNSEKEASAEEINTLKDRIGEIQYAYLIQKLDEISSGLSVRAKNGIHNYRGDFIEDFVYKQKDVKTIRHIGRKSEIEILSVIKQLRQLISTMDERAFSEEDVEIARKKVLYNNSFDDYVLQFYKEYKHLPMFYILEMSIKDDLKRERNFRAFTLHFPIFKDIVPKTLEEISDEYNMTYERARQIYMSFRNHLLSFNEKARSARQPNFADIIQSTSDWTYIIEQIKSNNFIETSTLKELQIKESHNFNDTFLLIIISLISKDLFLPIGKSLIPQSTRTKQKWENSYLVKKELVENFDFDRFLQLIEEYQDSNMEDLTITAREMIIDKFFGAWNNFDSNLVENLSEVITIILIQELGLIPDGNLNFTIEGKKKEHVEDIIYNLLQSNGNPLSLDELYDAIDSNYSHYLKSSSNLNKLVKHDPRLCMVGTNKLVALIEWNHVKIGNIRNIISQFLDEFNEPQSIPDIIQHVQQYRKTSENSIRSTLYSGNQFVRFSGGLYGLSWKEYPPFFYQSKAEREFDNYIHKLEVFIQKRKHFPFSSSNKDEHDLYYWWHKVKNSDSLTSYQRQEVKRINSTYWTYPKKKKRYQWNLWCEKYQSFVKKNGRRPSQYIDTERELYQWFLAAKRDFSEGNLTSAQEIAYMKLCKSL